MSHIVFATRFAGAAACIAALSAPAALPAAAEDYPWFPEIYPHHLRSRLTEADQGLQLAGLMAAERWYIDRLKRWDADTSIRVCFFGGSKELRRKIVSIAGRWAKAPNARVPLDFGDPENPRICKKSEFNHIRVGFEYKGYWSLVGQDSIEHAAQGEQSMNLAQYNINPPPEPTFTRVILHEFGHAIGFHHEHQSPAGPCQADFDWPAVETYLSGPPNYWDQQTIDFNMKSKPGEGAPGPFDAKSIMLYAFPKSFYKSGTKAECFTEGNIELSAGDLKGVAELYPVDIAQSRAVKQDAYQDIAAAIAQRSDLSAEVKGLALARAGELSAAGRKAYFETKWIADRSLAGYHTMEFKPPSMAEPPAMPPAAAAPVPDLPPRM